jgi:hypothetical protein
MDSRSRQPAANRGAGLPAACPPPVSTRPLPPPHRAAPRPAPQKAYQRVWADFHNLDHAFQRASLRAAFLQLPRGAVEHLICAQELRTVSENAVYLAVASWLRTRGRDAAAGGGVEEAAAAADAADLLRLVGGLGRGGAGGKGALQQPAALTRARPPPSPPSPRLHAFT